MSKQPKEIAKIDILDMVEKNEKMNEVAAPEKVIEQSN